MKTCSPFPFSAAAFAAFCSSCAAQTPPAAVVSPNAPAMAAPVSSAPGSADKIRLAPSMVTNESARGDAGFLVDEQELSGDPRTQGNKAGKPKTTWTIGYEARDLYYPLSAFIDLGAVHKLSDIMVFDSNSSGPLRIESGNPADWEPLVTDTLDSYQSWNRHAVDVETRYLRVVVSNPEALASEIVVYGKALAPIEIAKVPAPKAHPFARMDELIGTNAFIDDPLDKMQAVGFVREYHNWSWDSGEGPNGNAAFPNNLVAFNPSSAAGGNSWFFDDYYAKLKRAGVTVSPAIQGGVGWLSKGYGVFDAGQNRALPSSYKAHADHMFQFAARYGAKKVADSKLKLAPGQPRVSGLNLVRYFENANEPDAWWHGRDGYSTPYELAARTSADYDGHKKTMGDTFGVKNADPNAKLVLGGLAGLSLDYLKSMKAWADWHRGGDFPVDVINVHHYSNSNGGQTVGGANGGRVGISPEADKLRERMQAFVDYRNRYLPGKEMWLTEFGYDTHPGSPQRATAIGATPAEEVQARWIVRSYLLLAASGIDRAAQYMLRDVNPEDATQYSTSGLVTQKGEWKPKPAWFYTYTLKNRLAGMRFAGEVASGNEDVTIYKFQSDNGAGAYAVWCPTAENLVVDKFELPVGAAKSATKVQFVSGKTDGAASSTTIQGGKVSLPVSELVTLVLVDSLK